MVEAQGLARETGPAKRQMDDWNTGPRQVGQLTHRVRVKVQTRELEGIYRLEYNDEKGKRCREVIGPDITKAEKALAHMPSGILT